MINEISEKYIDTQKLYDDNILTKLKLKDTIILNGEVRHILIKMKYAFIRK